MQDSISTQQTIREMPPHPVVTSPVHSEEELLVVNPVQAPAAEAPAVAAPVRSVAKPAAVKARHEIPQLLAYPYVGSPVDAKTFRPVKPVPSDSTATSGDMPAAPAGDSAAAVDSTVIDSLEIEVPGEIKEGIILVNPVSAYTASNKADLEKSPWSGGMSWIYLALAVLFCVIGLKFKGSTRYLKALVTDLTDTRVRHNAFDDTVKETSLMVMLNMMWVACAGILLWTAVKMGFPPNAFTSGISIADRPAEGIGFCIGIAGIYMLLMITAYWVVGNVFSDSKLTRLWVKGAAASTGLQAFLMFPLALLALNYPLWNPTVLMCAAGVFVVGKIVFLYKGFRIFFTQISSWMLFLYYLCSLEIVPLILTYVATVAVCTTWL